MFHVCGGEIFVCCSGLLGFSQLPEVTKNWCCPNHAIVLVLRRVRMVPKLQAVRPRRTSARPSSTACAPRGTSRRGRCQTTVQRSSPAGTKSVLVRSSSSPGALCSPLAETIHAGGARRGQAPCMRQNKRKRRKPKKSGGDTTSKLAD